jgi:hypothetical protein
MALRLCAHIPCPIQVCKIHFGSPDPGPQNARNISRAWCGDPYFSLNVRGIPFLEVIAMPSFDTEGLLGVEAGGARGGHPNGEKGNQT